MHCKNCGHRDSYHADSDRLRLVAQRFCYVSWCDCQDFKVTKEKAKADRYWPLA